MELINKKRSFEMYYDPYDVVIHCDSEKARDEVLADLKAINDRSDVLDKIKAEIEECWQMYEDRFDVSDCLDIIDKYISRSEG